MVELARESQRGRVFARQGLEPPLPARVRVDLRQATGLEVLVNAALTYRDLDAVRQAAESLANFASSVSSRGQLIRSGGLRCVVHLLQHKYRPAVRLGLLAMQRLAAAGTHLGGRRGRRDGTARVGG